MSQFTIFIHLVIQWWKSWKPLIHLYSQELIVCISSQLWIQWHHIDRLSWPGWEKFMPLRKTGNQDIFCPLQRHFLNQVPPPLIPSLNLCAYFIGVNTSCQVSEIFKCFSNELNPFIIFYLSHYKTIQQPIYNFSYNFG